MRVCPIQKEKVMYRFCYILYTRHPLGTSYPGALGVNQTKNWGAFFSFLPVVTRHKRDERKNAYTPTRNPPTSALRALHTDFETRDTYRHRRVRGHGGRKRYHIPTISFMRSYV